MWEAMPGTAGILIGVAMEVIAGMLTMLWGWG
jgi:hypothetical protein